MECITVCPTLEKKTMSANIFGKFINLIFIVILGLGIYIGIIGISMITKIWKTQESSLSEAVNEGETLDPENIRGFMTMEEIAKTFNINVNDLYSELGITKNNVPVTSQMKKVGGLALKDGLNIGEDEIRNAVKKLAGKSLDKTEDKKDAVIKKDVPIEKDNEKNKTTTTAVTTTTKEINDKQDVNDEKKKTVDTKAESLPDPMTIKGTMTLKEIADNYKIDIDSLYEKLNLSKEKVPETTAGRDIKNILSNDGRTMEVQEIRDVVKELLKK
jgi:LysM repeat protein